MDLGGSPDDYDVDGERVFLISNPESNLTFAAVAQRAAGGGFLAPTHIAGQILADAICGDTERFDVFERVKHWKLPGGKWFANPALALGMLYFRLKEILGMSLERVHG